MFASDWERTGALSYQTTGMDRMLIFLGRNYAVEVASGTQ